MNHFPTIKVAAVQSSPVYLNKEATTQKVCDLIAQAASQGAELVAFPEVFVPGYPYWNWMMTPIMGSAWYEKLYLNSVDVPGPEVNQVAECAKTHGVHVVLGINERGQHSAGVIYNTLLIIDDMGELIGQHRKLVPTWAEKLTWTGGDGRSLKVYPTKIGNLGALACGENTNTLARFSLLAQGELLHVASYISLPVAPKDYDMAEAIKLRGIAHSFEGKVFTVVSCSTISEEMVEVLSADIPNAKELLLRKNSAFSGIIGPDGRVLDSLIDQEGIVYANVDLKKCIQPKQMHDIVGHYNRFDIFELTVNQQPQVPAQFLGASSPVALDNPPNNTNEETSS